MSAEVNKDFLISSANNLWKVTWVRLTDITQTTGTSHNNILSLSVLPWWPHNDWGGFSFNPSLQALSQQAVICILAKFKFHFVDSARTLSYWILHYTHKCWCCSLPCTLVGLVTHTHIQRHRLALLGGANWLQFFAAALCYLDFCLFMSTAN